MKTLYELYIQSHEAALTEHFKRNAVVWMGGAVWIWTTTKCCGGVRYGSYKYISMSDLKGRKYEIEYMDHGVSIVFTDCFYNPKTYKVERIEEERT
jgi:hypothetical protein